jgi:hypothetical protein
VASAVACGLLLDQVAASSRKAGAKVVSAEQ